MEELNRPTMNTVRNYTMSIYLSPPFHQFLTSPLTLVMRKRVQGKRRWKKRKRKIKETDGRKDREKDKTTSPRSMSISPFFLLCCGWLYVPRQCGVPTTLFAHRSKHFTNLLTYLNCKATGLKHCLSGECRPWCSSSTMNTHSFVWSLPHSQGSQWVWSQFTISQADFYSNGACIYKPIIIVTM